ncbi:MAG: hypothetical protein PW792_02065 [Acidobacteriaceae bacterium]|nr:hypothetical protein [Acidobacteriaceae bacterium]
MSTPQESQPQQPQFRVRKAILPGMAAIAMFLLLVTMLNAFAAMRGLFGTGAPRAGILGVCTLLLIGIFGLLRMRRWGWALVTGGCLVISIGDIYFFTHTHAAFFVVRGLLELCFFLYMVRSDVRDRVS